MDLVKQLVDPQLISRLVAAAAAVSPALRVENGAVIEKEQVSESSGWRLLRLRSVSPQFCYRPKTMDGDCMIGELEKGIFVATGHGPWVSFSRSRARAKLTRISPGHHACARDWQDRLGADVRRSAQRRYLATRSRSLQSKGQAISRCNTNCI